MARQIAYTDSAGAPHPAAYARVMGIDLGVARAQARMTVGIYHSAETRALGLSPVVSLEYALEGATFNAIFGDQELVPMGKSPLRAGYAHLKTLPLYQGGTDV